MKTLFIVITLTFAMGMLIISSIATSAFSSAASSSSLLLSPSKLSAAQAPVQASGSRSSPPSPSLPLTMIRFDTNTTIKDILAIHNLGIPFDKFIAKVSAVAKGQNATVSQIRAWNYIQSLVKINTDVCNLNQQRQQQQGANSNKDVGNIMMSSFLSLPPPPKTICDSKMSFAYEVCKGDPTISDCSATIRKYPSEAINNYIKTKNMHDGTQTDNLAYEELENISVSLNHIPNNTIANVVHFGSSEIATKS
ncbi:MAG TPA: hypothetical protein VFJ51_06025 [Nitrososphaeraceae archaeon]|nr:hypothetical protein [Nitrososphaeraceae archaeon]